MYKYYLSFKYLTHRLVNWISVVCVALAVTMLLAVMAIMGGFHEQLLDSYQSISSDLVLNANRVRDFSARDMRTRIDASDHVEASAYRFYTFGFVSLEGALRLTDGIKVFGVDPETESLATDFLGHLENVDAHERVEDPADPFNTAHLRDPSRKPKPGILLGNKLLSSLGAMIGDELTLTVATLKDEDLRGEARSVEDLEGEDPVEARNLTFIVAGTFSTGMYEYDNQTAYVPVSVEYDLLGVHGAGREIYIRLDDFKNASAARNAIRERVSEPVPIYTWEEMNQIFIGAVETEKAIQFFILAFMILLAGGCLMCVLTMTVVDKTRDVGIVKAIGGTVPGVLGIFVLNGFVIGLLGSALGLGSGILIIENINFIDEQIIAKIIGQRIFRPDIYVFDEIPTTYDPGAMSLTIGLTLLVSFIASLIPAWKASRFRPLEAMRYE